MNYLRWIFCCIIVSGCDMKDRNLEIDWNIAGTLPSYSTGTNHIGVAGPITGIINDVLVIFAGANFPNGMPWEGGIKTYSKEAYFYSIDRENTLLLTHTDSLKDSLAYSANVSFDNSIYAIAGERNGIATADVYRYFIDENILNRDPLPSLPTPLTNGGATRIGDYLYFVGGENEEFVSNKIYRLRISSDSKEWEFFAEIPKPITHAIVTSDEQQKIYVIGGRMRNANAKSNMYDEVYSLDIKTKKILLEDRLPEPLAAGTGGYYDGNLIVIGGDNAQTFHQVEELIGAINLEADENKKAELIHKKNKIQRSHPGFSSSVWCYDLKRKNWYQTDNLEGKSIVTTTAVFYNGLIFIPSGEIRAGVRTNQILIGKIK